MLLSLPIVGCYDGRQIELKRIADAQESIAKEKPKKDMKLFYDSLDRATKVKIDSIMFYFDKAMDFSFNGQSDSCKKYLKVMQEYSLKK